MSKGFCKREAMNIKSRTFLPILISLIFLVAACTSIKLSVPNTSIIDPAYPAEASLDSKSIQNAKALLKDLSTVNSVLANELGKLPDFHDGVTSPEIEALETLIKLYRIDPDLFNDAFFKMYTIGKPEFRKYCAPLEALFWLVQEYRIEEVKKQLDFYRTGIASSDNWPLLEPHETRFLLAKAWDFNDAEKWGDPHQVMDRLNSPVLFEYWFAHNFAYDWSKFWITAPDAYPQSAERSIRTKEGICFDAAYLAYKCLKRTGYDATGLNVYFGRRARSGAIMHSVCIIKMKDLDKSVYYRLADTNSPGYIQGPFESVKAVAERIAQGHGVPLGRYTTGLPSYHYHLF
jgi:hypothetical protein